METEKIKDKLKKSIEPKIQLALRARDSAGKRVKGYRESQVEAEKQIANLKIEIEIALQAVENVLTSGKDPTKARDKVDSLRNELRNTETWLKEVEIRLPQAHQDFHAAESALKDRIYSTLKAVALSEPQAMIAQRLDEISEVVGAVDAAILEITRECGVRLEWDQREALMPLPPIPDSAKTWISHFATAVRNR